MVQYSWCPRSSILRYIDVLPGFPPLVLFLDFAFSVFAIAGFRISKRLYLHSTRRTLLQGRPTLVVGAGAAGERLVRSLLGSADSGYIPVGFLDDDHAKHGTIVHGVPVLGALSELPSLVRKYRASTVIIAIPSVPSQVVREVVSLARSAGLTNIRILPGLTHLLSGNVSLGDLREVRVEDLLGREMVSINVRDVEATLYDKRVLVTGAAGFIGAELCQQILRFNPTCLVLLDKEETALFEIHRKLQGQLENHMVKLVPVLADILDERKVQALFERIRPDTVIHAAAYKHVGLLECHPEEAVRTNVVGTAVLAEAAQTASAQRFVLISTDKAVNPTSVMGATKRAAEQLCLAWNDRGPTCFMAVRFGNVLGSRGSVIPIFQEQIRQGGPVTVRGANSRRYFMAVSEAALLVLEAAAIGEGGEVFALDMDSPFRLWIWPMI